MRRRVDEIRAEQGLKPLGMSVTAYTGRLPLYLVGNIRELDYGRRDLPSSVHYLGACLWHPAEEPGTTAWLDGLPRERPWVHVTESTLQYGDPFILRSAAHGLAGTQVEAILTTGRQRDPESLGLDPLSPNIHITRWLSHAELLPRCAVVVTAGGPATITASIASGVPVVVVPTTWDKPDNARRVVEAGVGVRLPPRRCTPERLRDAVEEVLDNPGYAVRARELAVELNGAPGPDGAVALLERLVRDQSKGWPAPR
jgi:UDP:flavonoid glycosyltransferase YjiC (YdhE family)